MVHSSVFSTTTTDIVEGMTVKEAVDLCSLVGWEVGRKLWDFPLTISFTPLLGEYTQTMIRTISMITTATVTTTMTETMTTTIITTISYDYDYNNNYHYN